MTADRISITSQRIWRGTIPKLRRLSWMTGIKQPALLDKLIEDEIARQPVEMQRKAERLFPDKTNDSEE